MMSRWWQLKSFWNFHPENWGRNSPIFTNIFQMGWFSHQSDVLFVDVPGNQDLQVVLPYMVSVADLSIHQGFKDGTPT